jgi:hypothetical protein
MTLWLLINLKLLNFKKLNNFEMTRIICKEGEKS